MNRLSWDSTAPRRLGRRPREQRRGGGSLVEAEAELIRPALAALHRVWPFT
jgi:hypothetical protein